MKLDKDATESTFRHLLLVRPQPQNRQCIQDYLMSLAEANKLSGISELCELYGMNPAMMVRLNKSEIQELIRGVPPTKAIEFVRLNFKRTDFLWRPLHSRICPLCIEQNIPTPNAFNLPFSFICANHQSGLYDSCPTCNSQYTYLRKSRKRCNRGCLIRSVDFPTIDADVIKVQKVFSPWKLCTHPTLEYFSTIYFEKFICKLIRVLCEANRRQWVYRKIDSVEFVKLSKLLIKNNSYFLEKVEKLYEAISAPELSDAYLVNPILQLYNTRNHGGYFRINNRDIFL